MPASQQPTHLPVLLQETLRFLELQPGQTVLDATVGLGGHSESILRIIGPRGFLIGSDADSDALSLAEERLRQTGAPFDLLHANFADLDQVLSLAGQQHVDRIVADLGLSSYQLAVPAKGFSLAEDGPLDMRYDRSRGRTAADVVARLSERELADVIYRYGEERWARRVAKAIVSARRRHPIRTTGELADIVDKAIPGRRGRIARPTKTFQAIRIFVNREIDVLARFLDLAPKHLRSNGRLVVISFHSLEDRLVKQAMREGLRSGLYAEIAKKPIRPTDAEVERNPRSRSAKLRFAVRSDAPWSARRASTETEGLTP